MGGGEGVERGGVEGIEGGGDRIEGRGEGVEGGGEVIEVAVAVNNRNDGSILKLRDDGWSRLWGGSGFSLEHHKG